MISERARPASEKRSGATRLLSMSDGVSGPTRSPEPTVPEDRSPIRSSAPLTVGGASFVLATSEPAPIAAASKRANLYMQSSRLLRAEPGPVWIDEHSKIGRKQPATLSEHVNLPLRHP